MSAVSSVSVNGKLNTSSQIGLHHSRSPSPSFARSYLVHSKQPAVADHHPHHSHHIQTKASQQQQLDLPPPATPPLPQARLASSTVAIQNAATNGAKQLNKLKRFLTTLQQFASDISPEINERVKHLILNLIVS